MKKSTLQIMLLLFICFSNVFCWAQWSVPINVEFTISPNKEVSYPGDEINVNVHAYFDRELLEIEKGKEFLIIGRFTEGCSIQTTKPRMKSNLSDWSHVYISESTFSDTLIYMHDPSEEVRGSFKIEVQEDFRGLHLRAVGYTLGKEFFNDKLISNSLMIKGENTHYIGNRFYRGGKTRLLPNKQNEDKPNVSEPQGYDIIDRKIDCYSSRNRDYIIKYLTNRTTEIRFEDGVDVLDVWCTDEDVGICTENENIWYFIAEG